MTTVLPAPAGAPAVGWASGPLGLVQACDREVSRRSALRYRAVAAFALSRPASVDRPQGTRGAMAADRWAVRPELLRSVSEWATQELSIALSLTATAAESLLTTSLTLVHRLPATLDALESGAVHGGHVTAMLDHVAPVADDTVRAKLERDLLAWATRRGAVCTPAQLRDKARREVLKRKARSAAEDLARAITRRGLSCRPDSCDGMAVVSALLTTPEAAALLAALGAYADALPDDGRTRGQKMADALLDLVLRPGENGLSPVQVVLTVVAPVGALLGGDQPCEIDGQVVPAEVVRALLSALTGARITAAEDAAAPAEDAVPEDTATEDTATEDTATEDTATEDTATEDTATEDTAVEHPAAGDPEDTVPDVPADATAETLADGWDEPIPAEVLERWAAEEDARTAETLPDGWDDPIPEQVLIRWAAEEDARVAGQPPPGWSPPRDDLDPDDHADHPEDRADHDPDPPPDRPGPPEPDGWWARADDAVNDAGAALLDADQAIGRARRLVATAERADASDEGAWEDSPAGRVTSAADAVTALTAATDDTRLDLADLLGRTAGGGLADRPRIAVTHALTGALLTLTDLPELRRATRAGTGLHAPSETDGYRPAAALDRHVRARDRRCRFPGCRRPVPKRGELDHATPWPLGATTAANLTGFCTGHHRGKHQAPGWHHDLQPHGTLTVTTPSGLTASTEPPPY
ncbi:HNH endonuclease signature motif containing protein [Geodermatophilus sp. FMUSA9-8]|uniref:HNH endonuclease signature motif containing protein n=1 Tax=Geodermatophilus sp. FMUSA9-8 TaxID=3120155 RepID=UPI003008631A